MTIRVGINGFGRIGRAFVRRALERDEWGYTCRLADLAAIVGARLQRGGTGIPGRPCAAS